MSDTPRTDDLERELLTTQAESAEYHRQRADRLTDMVLELMKLPIDGIGACQTSEIPALIAAELTRLKDALRGQALANTRLYNAINSEAKPEVMTELSTTFKELERENAALREAVAEARAILKLWEDTETDPQDGEEYDEFMEGFTARVARFLVETEGRSQATVVPIIDGLIGRPIPPHASGPPAFYHQIPKVGACAHEWDRQEFPQQCVKCGMSFLTHIHMEMP